MTLKKIESNIRELQRNLNGKSGREAMVIRNCITTMEDKRREAKRELHKNKEKSEMDRSNGYTLVELMVTLFMIGLSVGGVILCIFLLSHCNFFSF